MTIPRDIVTIDYNKVHYRLRDTREQAELPLIVVAEDLGIGPQYLGQLELNRDPNVWAHIVALAGYYGTTTDYLLGVPWCNNRERQPGTARTNEAIAAMDLIDGYPPAVREAMLESLRSLARVFSSLVDQARENITLRLALAEYATRLSADDITISDSTVAERLAQLLTSENGKSL